MFSADQSIGGSVSCNFQANSQPTVAVRRRLSALGVMLLAWCVASSVRAAEESSFQLTPFAGYATGDDLETSGGERRKVDDTGGWGLALDWEQQAQRYYELIYTSFNTEIKGGAAPLDLDIDYLQIGGTVAWTDLKHVIPYFGMTVGAAHFSPDLDGLDSATKFAFSVAAGARIPVTKHIGLRAEWRTYVTVLGSDSNLFCESSGGAATCELQSRSDTFLQHSAQLGVSIGF